MRSGRRGEKQPVVEAKAKMFFGPTSSMVFSKDAISVVSESPICRRGMQIGVRLAVIIDLRHVF